MSYSSVLIVILRDVAFYSHLPCELYRITIGRILFEIKIPKVEGRPLALVSPTKKIILFKSGQIFKEEAQCSENDF